MNAGRTSAGGAPTSQPLYKEVKSRITKSLIAGEWKPGAAIPSESQLSAQFHVSVGTIRKAIDELVAEKIVIRQQGRGTFVTLHSEDRQFYYFFHIVGRQGGKEPPSHELLSMQTIKADAATASELALKPGERVHRVHNVLKLAGKPVIFDELRVAAARFPGSQRSEIRRARRARSTDSTRRITASTSCASANDCPPRSPRPVLPTSLA